MNHTKTKKPLRMKDFGGRIFTTINTTAAVKVQKKKIALSHGPKAPLVPCVFYLVLICTCFWHLPKTKTKKKTEKRGFHGPARLCGAERNPPEKSQLPRLRTPRARATEPGWCPNVRRRVPACLLRAPQPQAREKDSQPPEKSVLRNWIWHLRLHMYDEML